MRPSGGGLETKASAPVREVGRSRKAGVVPPWPDLPVGDWIATLAYHSDTWASPRVACLSARAFVGKPVREGPRVYEPDTWKDDANFDLPLTECTCESSSLVLDN